MQVPRYLPAVVSRLALLALAVGAGVWGAILLAPSPPAAPPTALSGSTLHTDTLPVARWFGTGAGAKIQVVVAGLISDGPHGSAVLAIDGRPARAYAVGHELAEGVHLAEVLGTGVVLDQGGERVEVLASKLPPIDGIRSAPVVSGASARPAVLAVPASASATGLRIPVPAAPAAGANTN